jgi:ABC-type Fe3+-siderophore transport system permease subunit
MTAAGGVRGSGVRPALVVTFGLVAAFALVVAHLLVGRADLPPDDVLRAVVGRASDPAHEVVVLRYRLPRVLVGLAAGCLLALSGVLVQAVVRNPLAEPATIGVGPGAALAVVVWLVAGPGHGTTYPAAFAGALAAGGLLLLVGRRSPAVAGVLLGAVLAGAASFVLVLDAQPMGTVMRWLVGSLNGRTGDDVVLLLPWLLLLPVLAWLLSPWLNVLALGDVATVTLGLRPGLARAAVLGTATAAGAAAVAAAGAVAFVGLVAPHVARLLAGPDHRRLVPVAAVCGAVLLSAADLLAFAVTVELPLVGRSVSGVPVGAVTALLGAPLLISLVRKEVR